MRLTALLLLLLITNNLSAQTVADFKTKELLVFDFKDEQNSVINNIWYSSNNGQFVRLGIKKQVASSPPMVDFEVVFPNEPKKVYKLSYSPVCGPDVSCINPDGSKQNFSPVSENKKPAGTIIFLLLQDIDGTYLDDVSGEVIVLKKINLGLGYESYYSNGKTPFVPMVISGTTPELSFELYFPNQPQTKYTCKWIRGGGMARFELKNPNGKKQEYMRLYGPKIPPLNKAPDKNKLIGGFCKPITFLYPTTPTDVQVKLKTTERLSVTYPEYDSMSGWQVQASPDGTLRNHTGEYSYLFWETEAPPNGHPLPDSGFVIRGAESATFLKEKLAGMGFTPKEYNEFIVYWFPILKQNPYVQVHFAYEYIQGGRDYSNPSGKSYRSLAGIAVNPKPETLFRLMMYYSPIPFPTSIPAQRLPQLVRKGFSVVEWGGTEARVGKVKP